ncbi:MAG: STAS domain-containing protein [Pseudomonadota bacterium]|nr:STAS domain-containing protein [Pseudomonadota bacterium]
MIYKTEESDLTISHANRIYDEALMHIALATDIKIDLTSVTKIDTAGVAAIISWWRHIQSKGVQCEFIFSQVIKDSLATYHIKLPIESKET